MKKILTVAVLSVLAVLLYAQSPSRSQAAQAAAAPDAAAADKKTSAKAQKLKQAEADADDGTVMIDSKADPESNQAESSQADRGEADVRGGIPTSYGQCKGVINEGGRNLLIFESIEDGTIYFVQVMVGKNTVSWKLVDHIGRSAD